MKLSTDPYKGVRDFYPDDMAIQKKIFDIWRKNVEKYGYEEYNASILEPAELYKAKTGEEIVNKQTYTFIDRGEREVTLRPEMTPTVARMVAGKKRELAFPLRWYSIPNLFRYEQPQRGRLREHWQLNVDIFGVDSIQAEVEIIQITYDITRAYGLKDTDFEIRLNNRKLMNYVTKDVFGLSDEQAHKISKLIDKKDKIPEDVFSESAKEIFASESIDSVDKKENNRTNRETDRVAKFLTLLNSKNFEEFTTHLPQTKEEHQGISEIRGLMANLEKLGITNTRFDQTLMRGFDYYTGIVFEVFDKNPTNHRSVFGGGRYDDLLSIFGGEKVPAVGFGAGDVVAQDLMEIYRNNERNKSSPADLAICIVDSSSTGYAQDIAQKVRNGGLRVSVDYSFRKIGEQIKKVDRQNISYVLCIGEEEMKTGKLRLKNLKTGEENIVDEEEIINSLKK
ncbi:MAG TPA: histidine--tRNA ligase [Candidatus Paceibacterota bacterium]